MSATQLVGACGSRGVRSSLLRRGRRAPFVMIAALATISHAALAAPATDARAEALFNEGQNLMHAKRYADACPKLAESLKLEPGIGVRLFLADCLEKTGQRAQAFVQFRAAATDAAKIGDAREKIARRRAVAIEAQLTRVLIVLPPERRVGGIEVRRDGVPISLEDTEEPIPVDSGIHTFSASAPNHDAWSVLVEIPSTPGVTRVNIPLLEVTKVAPPSPTPPHLERPPQVDIIAPPKPPPPPPGWSAVRWMGIATSAVGLAGVGVGALLGQSASATYDESAGHCNAQNQCDAFGKQRRLDATALATGSTIAFAAGLTAVATGVVLFVMGKPPSATKASNFYVAPSLSAADGRVVIGRQF